MSKKPKTWPASTVEHCAIVELHPYPRNPNKHSPEQIELIKQSMLARGWTMPILVDEDNMILAGHGRVLAAQILVEEGHKQFGQAPIVIARGWSKADKQAYIIADNQLTRASEWDPDLLKMELGELVKLDFDMKLTGFGDLEIAKFVAWGNADGKDPEATPEPPAIPVSRRGDVWLLGKHRLMCGDATTPGDVSAALTRTAPNLMVTDPPYGVDYDPMWRKLAKREDGSFIGARAIGIVNNDHTADWQMAYELFPGDVAYVWNGGLRSSSVETGLMSAGFIMRSQIVWAKNRLIIGRGDYHWQHECCWYAVRKGKPGQWAGGRKQSTLWTIEASDRHEHSNHSAQKPIECMKRPIENNSNPGDAVYDPFIGSGTTIIAAEMTARRCIALEIAPVYVDVAVRRWEAFAEKEATLEGTKQTFKQVSDERLRPARGHQKKRRARLRINTRTDSKRRTELVAG